MHKDVEINCPKCHKAFRQRFEAKNLSDALTCPHCEVTFNCHSCNYSWAKWARGRSDCGEPCR